MINIILLFLIILFIIILFYYINNNIKYTYDKFSIIVNKYIENFISRHKDVNI